MKKTLRVALTGILLVPALALGISLASPSTDTYAQIDAGLNAVNTADNGQPTSLSVIFKNVVNVMLFVIGAVSVIMLIYGGIRYTTSGGNSNSVTAAKNTILYAIIGLIVAIFAYAIVNWVIGAATSGDTTR